jgi:hypothetical protein
MKKIYVEDTVFPILITVHILQNQQNWNMYSMKGSENRRRCLTLYDQEKGWKGQMDVKQLKQDQNEYV